jgi:hypothetical protein
MVGGKSKVSKRDPHIDPQTADIVSYPQPEHYRRAKDSLARTARALRGTNHGRPGPVRIIVQNGLILDRTRFDQIRTHVPAESLVTALNRCAQAGASEKAPPKRGSGSLQEQSLQEANVLPCNTPVAVNDAPDAQIRKAGNGQTTAPA